MQLGVIRQDTTNVVNVLDGMALIQKMKVRDITFSQLAKQIFQHVLNVTPKPVRTDLVFDVSKENSIKDAERVRKTTGDVRFQVIRGEQPIKLWRSFLSCSNNKNALINFLVEDWMKVDFTTQLQENIVCYQFRTIQNNYR